MAKYVEIPATQVPAGIRFDVTPYSRGQYIQVAYGGRDRGEHCPGDPYKRVTDLADRTTVYYRRA